MKEESWGMRKYRSLDSIAWSKDKDVRTLGRRPTAEEGLTVDRKIGLGLIDSRQLMRCSISDLLGRYGPEFSVLPYSSCHNLINSSADEKACLGLLILDLDRASVNSPEIQGDIDALHQEFPGVPLVLLSDRMDMDCSVGALCSKVSGYVTTNLSPLVAIAAIRLVYAGGKYFPAEVISNSTQQKELLPQNEHEKPAVDGLTSRQYEVFKQLKEGKSNKLIAYELGVQESTVKVHVREIMKKLHATNRTHAVFLASKLYAPESLG
jgi:DNA-binding NarL/FixJ family response regulator